jgi:hypothetical protein
VKPRSTQRKNSAVACASHSAGRPNYSAWSGGIAALLAENPLINTRLQPGVLPAKRLRAVLTACRPHQKPLKRFPASTRHNTGLKPGVNERQIVQTASEQSNILPTVLAKSPSSIAQTLSAQLEICGTVSHKSADAQKCQTVSGESSVRISATLSRKLDAKQIVQTLSGKSSMLAFRQALESEIEKMRRLLESPERRLRQK